MAAVPALNADLEQILMDSGATTGMNEYLLAMRITTPNVLAVFSPDEPHYRTNLVDPFVNGIKIGTVDHQTDIHPASTAAILLQVRTECMVKRAAATAAAFVPPAAPAMALVTASAPSSSVPKTLNAGVWTQQIRKYEMIQLNGVDRVFPSEILLGAEAVLARLLREHTSSKTVHPAQAR